MTRCVFTFSCDDTAVNANRRHAAGFCFGGVSDTNGTCGQSLQPRFSSRGIQFRFCVTPSKESSWR
jgi:hypothetical protein